MSPAMSSHCCEGRKLEMVMGREDDLGFSDFALQIAESLICSFILLRFEYVGNKKMHPPLTIHRHPMCTEIIELFQKCHTEHPIGKFFGNCTDLKIKLDKCFRREKAVKRKANFEQSKKLKERLQAYRKENAENNFVQA
ncbi:unnamed protein product [Fraxinus pennsylvanica]|uniref:COX assembly mitochondrial protein n=1 Tax=Fraxinus pennsylvanica TaxID=56036 RepID=A0AAD1Z5S0_9LAMI|nr:unnamed protein product [Fraxinus pennsylvanica]